MAKRDGRSGPRTAKQKAATKRMLAARKAAIGGHSKSTKKHKKSRKGHRSAAQKAATARMLAGLRASRKSGGGVRGKKRGPGRPKGSRSGTTCAKVGGVTVRVSVEKD